MDIKTAYESGMSAYKIAELVGVSSPTIYSRLRALGIKIRTSAQTSTKALKHIDKILLNFDSGISVSKLAKQYGYSITGMSNLLKRSGRKITQPEDIERNWSFIEKQDILFFYWLGWMLADGCIYYTYNGRNRGIRTYLTVQNDDRHILEFFKNIIQKAVKIQTIKTTNCFRLNLAIPRDIAIIVEQFGFIPNKTYKFKLTDKLKRMTNEQFCQFMCGMIEGDGCIENRQMKSKSHVYSMRRLRIYNHPNLIEWIRGRLAELGFDRKMVDLRPKSHCAVWSIAGADADRLIRILLESQYHLLDRKWSKLIT